MKVATDLQKYSKLSAIKARGNSSDITYAHLYSLVKI